MGQWSAEETSDPNYADKRNFYKVEKWTKDGMRLERWSTRGNSLDKAPEVYRAIQHRPRGRLTIRQRNRVLERWPNEA